MENGHHTRFRVKGLEEAVLGHCDGRDREHALDDGGRLLVVLVADHLDNGLDAEVQVKAPEVEHDKARGVLVDRVPGLIGLCLLLCLLLPFLNETPG